MTYKDKDIQGREHSLHRTLPLNKDYVPSVGDILVPLCTDDLDAKLGREVWYSALQLTCLKTPMVVTDVTPEGHALVLVGCNLWVLKHSHPSGIDSTAEISWFTIVDGHYNYPLLGDSWRVFRDLHLHERGPT
jgi:hypothetical protein